MRRWCRPRQPCSALVSLSLPDLGLAALALWSGDETLRRCAAARDPLARVASIWLAVRALHPSSTVIALGWLSTTQKSKPPIASWWSKPVPPLHLTNGCQTAAASRL